VMTGEFWDKRAWHEVRGWVDKGWHGSCSIALPWLLGSGLEAYLRNTRPGSRSISIADVCTAAVQDSDRVVISRLVDTTATAVATETNYTFIGPIFHCFDLVSDLGFLLLAV
jgi:hypothetical protein